MGYGYSSSLDEREKKRMFDGKKIYASNKFEQNAEIMTEKGLTEEQIEVVKRITEMRHEIHTNPESLFNTAHPDFSEYFDFIYDINEELKNVGLPIIKNLIDVEDLIDDNDFFDFNNFETLEEAYWEYLKQHEEINNAIENWMKEFDEKFGTEITPTGIARNKDIL